LYCFVLASPGLLLLIRVVAMLVSTFAGSRVLLYRSVPPLSPVLLHLATSRRSGPQRKRMAIQRKRRAVVCELQHFEVSQ
jgi:hypothetical protein